MRSADAGFSTITSGTPRCLASAHTCVLNRSPSGLIGGESSADRKSTRLNSSHLLPYTTLFRSARPIAVHEPVEYLVRPRVGDPEIPFVSLAFDEISRRGLLDNHVRYAQVPRERPHLRLEQVAQRIDRR